MDETDEGSVSALQRIVYYVATNYPESGELMGGVVVPAGVAKILEKDLGEWWRAVMTFSSCYRRSWHWPACSRACPPSG